MGFASRTSSLVQTRPRSTFSCRMYGRAKLRCTEDYAVKLPRCSISRACFSKAALKAITRTAWVKSLIRSARRCCAVWSVADYWPCRMQRTLAMQRPIRSLDGRQVLTFCWGVRNVGTEAMTPTTTVLTFRPDRAPWPVSADMYRSVASGRASMCVRFVGEPAPRPSMKRGPNDQVSSWGAARHGKQAISATRAPARKNRPAGWNVAVLALDGCAELDILRVGSANRVDRRRWSAASPPKRVVDIPRPRLDNESHCASTRTRYQRTACHYRISVSHVAAGAFELPKPRYKPAARGGPTRRAFARVGDLCCTPSDLVSLGGGYHLWRVLRRFNRDGARVEVITLCRPT
jgi:hypothetical protein